MAVQARRTSIPTYHVDAETEGGKHRFDMSIAELGQELERYLADYLDSAAFYDPRRITTLWAFDYSFQWLTTYAEEIHYRVPETEAEWAIMRRAIAVWPTEKQQARMSRPPIKGLSRRFQWLNAMRDKAMERMLDLHMVPFDEDDIDARVAHRDFCSEGMDAFIKVSKAIRAQTPITAGDLELRRRVLHPVILRIWLKQGLAERRRGMGPGPRRINRYKAGHLIDPHRRSWG